MSKDKQPQFDTSVEIKTRLELEMDEWKHGCGLHGLLSDARQRIAELESEVQMYKNKYIMQEVDLDEAEAEIRRLKQAEHENQ